MDVEDEVLAPRGQYLVVEEGVAVVVRQVLGDQVVLFEGGQHADHDDARVELRRLAVGVSDSGSDLLREPVEHVPLQLVGGDVHFEVEHSEFRLEIGARDLFENRTVQHAGQTVRTGEIELDLHAHEIARAVEPLLRQEPREPRQTLLEFPPVLLPVGRAEPVGHDLLAHRSVLPRVGGRQGGRASRTMMPTSLIHNACGTGLSEDRLDAALQRHIPRARDERHIPMSYCPENRGRNSADRLLAVCAGESGIVLLIPLRRPSKTT